MVTFIRSLHLSYNSRKLGVASDSVLQFLIPSEYPWSFVAIPLMVSVHQKYCVVDQPLRATLDNTTLKY